MKGLVWAIILILLIIVLVLVFSGDRIDTENTPKDSAEAVESVTANLKTSGLIATDSEIEVKKVEFKNWPDACLGISEVNRVCAQVITPGFEITLEAEDRDFIYRTDIDGEFVVLAEQK